MDRAEALSSLAAGSAHERLKAARALLSLAKPEDREAIAHALRSETDGYTKTALRQALRQMVEPTPLVVAGPSPDADEVIYADIYSKAVEETSARVVHELR